MFPSLKLVSLNIECREHLDLVLPFLEREMPDIATIQELCEQDIPRFAEVLGSASWLFVPMGRELRSGTRSVYGIGIFSRLPMTKQDIRYYSGSSGNVLESNHDKPETYNLANRALAMCDVEKEGAKFRVCTTHFTWSPDGRATELQRRDMPELLRILDTSGDFILTGDFNAPRGLPGQRGEIFGMLAKKYKDNVPAKYTTSIDGSLHRAGQLEFMVDGLFSTPGFVVSDVEMVSGVSDHCALTAVISRAD